MSSHGNNKIYMVLDKFCEVLTKMPTIGEPMALAMEYKAKIIPSSLCPIPL